MTFIQIFVLLVVSAFVTSSCRCAADERPVTKDWMQKAFLAQPTTAPKHPGLELLRQDYDKLGFGTTCVAAPIVLGKKSYKHGLGTHANSEIVVRLPKPGTEFQAEVGVDNGWPGSVCFAVDVNGKEIFKSDVLEADGAPVPVRCDLHGVSEFTIRVTDGGDGPSSDHASWADARVTLADGKQIWLDELPRQVPYMGLSTDIPFSFNYDGKPSSSFLSSWTRSETKSKSADGKESWSITYTDPDTGLEVICDAIQYTDYPAVEWVMHFRNTGSVDTPIIDSVRPLNLGVNTTNSSPVVLHHSKGSTCSSTDFLPVNESIDLGATINIEPGGGRSSDSALPFFNLEWDGGGVVGAIGWSGQWAMSLTRAQDGKMNLQAGQKTTHLRLHPGESIRTPRILLVMWQGKDAMRGHNLLRRLLLAHYVPKQDGQIAVAPTTWNSWFSFDGGNSVDEANQLDWIKRTAKTGMECYWLDAGWFEGGWPAGAGSWVPDSKRFPRGLRPLGDAAHKEGMKFVLWLEPERVNPNSRLAKEHPKWVIQDWAKNSQPGDGLLNIGDPVVYRWLTDYLTKCFADWGVDIYRIDFNIAPLAFWQSADTPDRQGMTEIRYIEALYSMWDELMRRHPGLTIDNCASGGRRLDLETLSRSYPLWRSDIPCMGKQPVWDQVQTAGLSLYVPQHTTGVWAMDPYTYRSAATMGVSICPDPRAKGYSLDQTKQALAEVKRLRLYYLGDYYPIFDIGLSEQGWAGWQFDRPELGGGFATVLRRPQCPYVSADIKLRGLEDKAVYKVSFYETYKLKTERQMTGIELSKLRVTMDTAPGSLLIEYKKLSK